MIIKTSDIKSIKPFLDKLYIPSPDSHKGQNGRVLVIGGSSLFHAASIWAAEAASYFVDIVHYSSTEANNKIFFSLKKKFQNGIVVSQKDIDHYIEEDDAVLIGPGMVRGKIAGEAGYTYELTKSAIDSFPKKKFVFDAGALQMMEAKWLLKLKEKPILTPQNREFETLFGIKVADKPQAEKIKIAQEIAKKYKCVIVLKTIMDIISDGEKTYVVEGGNAGLTKGGTGDIFAGLTLALYAKNDPITSVILASFILKKTAETLFLERGYWYNITNIVDAIPKTLKKLKLI